MSIAVYLCGKDGIVLATDSRLMSQPVSGGQRTAIDDETKLWNIGNNVGIASVSNIVGYEIRLIHKFQRQSMDKTLDFEQVADEFATFVTSDWIEQTKHISPELFLAFPHSYLMNFLLAGYTASGIPTMRRILCDVKQQVFTPREKDKTYDIEGIPELAQYWMGKLKDNLSSSNLAILKRLAVFLISESSKFYLEVGGPIQMLTIQRDTGVQWITSKEIDSLKEDLDKTMPKIRQLLTRTA
jgi:hypothetical protein